MARVLHVIPHMVVDMELAGHCTSTAMGQSSRTHMTARRAIFVTATGVVLRFRVDIRQEAAYPSRGI